MTATEQKHSRQNVVTQPENGVKLPGIATPPTAQAASAIASATQQRTIDISLAGLPQLPPAPSDLITTTRNGTTHTTLHRLDGQIAAIRRGVDGSFLNTIYNGASLVGVSNHLSNGQVLSWSKGANGEWVSNHALFPRSKQSPLRPDGTLSYQDGEGIRHTIAPNGKHTRSLS